VPTPGKVPARARPPASRRVRLNGLLHGLCAHQALLTGEDPQAFTDLGQSFYQEFQPVGPIELFCVEKIALLYWRMRRLGPMEAGFFRTETAPEPASFVRVARYEAYLDRAFYRAIAELRELQSVRDIHEFRGVPKFEVNPRAATFVPPPNEPQLPQSSGLPQNWLRFVKSPSPPLPVPEIEDPSPSPLAPLRPASDVYSTPAGSPE